MQDTKSRLDATTLSDHQTLRLEAEDRIEVRGFKLTIIDYLGSPSAALKRGDDWESSSDTCSIGSHPSNDFALPDKAVSRFHCQIQIESKGARLLDLGSVNGTRLGGVRIDSAFLEHESEIQVGRVLLRFELLDRVHSIITPNITRFGKLVSSSRGMRHTFEKMERAAASDFFVLLEGETGTGKSTAAREIHERSQRRNAPFKEVNCAAIPPNLIEAELFGHEKGAFTGAVQSRPGIFEEANKGTLFLDEIAELSPEAQAKLLKVSESGQVTRIGGKDSRKIDVRIISATNKDLKTEVNAGRFRADLYYRLAVLCIKIPALRHRPEDIGMIVDELLRGFEHVSEEQKRRICSPSSLASLRRERWPGNIRELRHYLAQSIAMDGLLSPEAPPAEGTGFEIDACRPLKDERDKMLAAFEREYLLRLMELHSGNITRAAETAQITRVHLHRLLHKYGIR